MAKSTRKTTVAEPPAQVAPVPTSQPAPVFAGTINAAALDAINRATSNNTFGWMEPAEYMPLLSAGFVEVNETHANPANTAQRPVIITDAGKIWLADHVGASQTQPAPAPAPSPFPSSAAAPAPSYPTPGNYPPATPVASATAGSAPRTRRQTDPDALKAMFGAMQLNTNPGALPPPRRGGGAIRQAQPTPLDNLELGQAFDIPVSAQFPNPGKAFQSLVANANRKHSHETGETEMRDVEVAVTDEHGNPLIRNGAEVIKIERREVRLRAQDRKFELRSMFADDGVTLIGARIQRTL